MAATKKNEQKLNALAAFFDEGAYTELYADKDGTVAAGYGTAEGCPAYALAQNGGALTSADVAKMVRVMDLAAKTGNPIVTFYDSNGSVLTEGFEALTDAAKLVEAGARISGVVPQIAVVLGTCAASQAIAAAAADVTIMAKDAELFLTAPFTSAAAGEKNPKAGSAELAAKDGIVELVYESAEAAVSAAANLVGILPSNNLSSAAVFDFEGPEAALDLNAYTGARPRRRLSTRATWSSSTRTMPAASSPRWPPWPAMWWASWRPPVRTRPSAPPAPARQPALCGCAMRSASRW